MIDRRLKKAHQTVVIALAEKLQELQREIRELDQAVDAQVQEYAASYGLDPDRRYVVNGREDGELYLELAPEPQSQAPEEGEEED